MMNIMISADLYHKEFTEKWTIGFKELVERVKEYSPERVEASIGVPAGEIRGAARMFATIKPAWPSVKGSTP